MFHAVLAPRDLVSAQSQSNRISCLEIAEPVFFSFDQELCYLFYYLKLSQPGNQTLWKRQSTNGGAIAFKCFFSFKAVFRCYKYINSEDGKHKCLIIVDYNFNNICIHVILMLDNIIKRIILSEMTKPWVW